MDVEKSAEKELELKNELKFMIGKLMHFKRSGLSSEIERVLIEKSIIRANRLIGRRN